MKLSAPTGRLLGGSSSLARRQTPCSFSGRQHVSHSVGLRTQSGVLAFKGHRSTHRLLQPLRVASVDQQASDEPPNDGKMTYCDYLNAEYGIQDCIVFNEGENGMPRVWVRHPSSALGFELYLHGAAITQWLRPNGQPALNYDPRNVNFNPNFPIRGGLRLAFPTYRESTTMSEDGFASRMPWEVVAAGFDFMGLDDGMRTQKYQAALDRFAEIEREAMERGYWLPENQGEEVKRKADLAAKFFQKKHEEDRELESKFDEQQAQALQELAELNAQIEAAGAKEGEEQEDTAAEGSSSEGEAAESAQDSAGSSEAESSEAESSKTGSSKAKAAEDREGEVSSKGTEEVGSKEGGDVEGREGSVSAEEQGEGGSSKEGVAASKKGGVGFNEEDLDEDSALTLQALREIDMRIEAGQDPAPFITLRLADTPDTRAMFPHKFELLYKITLSEEDDYKDPLPDGENSYKEEEDLENEEEEDEIYRPLPAGGRLDERGRDVPVQLKTQMLLRNLDEPGSQPMEFQVAKIATFATRDILLNTDMVKILGLAGSTALNYGDDDRDSTLQACKEDFILINGQRLDATFIKAADSSIKLSPADGTHFEIQARKGLIDAVAFHPGSTRERDTINELLTLGVGNVMIPTRLDPGQEWESELVLRWFNEYWKRPPFEKGMLPMPALQRQDFSLETADSNPLAGVQDVEDEQA